MEENISICKDNIKRIEETLFQTGEVNSKEVLGKIYNCLYAIDKRLEAIEKINN